MPDCQMRAIEMSLFVLRAFVRLRELAGTHAAASAETAAPAWLRELTGRDVWRASIDMTGCVSEDLNGR